MSKNMKMGETTIDFTWRFKDELQIQDIANLKKFYPSFPSSIIQEKFLIFGTIKYASERLIEMVVLKNEETDNTIWIEKVYNSNLPLNSEKYDYIEFCENMCIKVLETVMKKHILV